MKPAALAARLAAVTTVAAGAYQLAKKYTGLTESVDAAKASTEAYANDKTLAKDFDVKSWFASLKGEAAEDAQALLRALEGEYPSHHDLAILDQEALKSFGLKPLQRTRILKLIEHMLVPEQHIELDLPRRDTTGNKALDSSVLLSKQTLDDLDWDGKRVLVRVDYNVPIKDGVVTSTARVDQTIPTLKRLLETPNRKPKAVVLICHRGRPAGNFDRKANSLQPVLEVLQGHLEGHRVEFLPDCVGPQVEEAINTAAPGTVFLLENTRFHFEETGKTKNEAGETVKATPEEVAAFEDALSRLGDVFVFEAFGAAHRKQASVTGIKIEQRVAGLLMQKELDYFGKVLGAPQRPFVAIIGGSKVSDKIQVIENMLGMVDEMIIGGGMAYTFKKVIDGVSIGSSLFDEEGAKNVKNIMDKAKQNGVKIHLPVDHVIADNFAENANYGVTDDKTGIPAGWLALDVGPLTRGINKEVILNAKTIIWNGPLGVFEMGAFAAGTLSAMCHLVQATKQGCTTIIGGGDTGAASYKFFSGTSKVADQVSHVSTGGGSSLVLMEGKMLPAVEHLSDKQ